MKESDISKQIVEYLTKDLRPAWARKLHVGLNGGKGEPDIYGCVPWDCNDGWEDPVGRMVQIETKRPGEDRKLLQVEKGKRWQAAGAIYIVATSVDDVRRELAAHGVV